MTSAPVTPPPTNGRYGMASWAVQVVQGLTLQNILTLALLIVVAVPAYFAWRWMTDEEFRHEFYSSLKIVDAKVPCLVIEGNLAQQATRTSVLLEYDVRNRVTYVIGIQMPTIAGAGEIENLCLIARTEAEKIRSLGDHKPGETKP